MRGKIGVLSALVGTFIAVLPGNPAQAQNPRSWVASYGSGVACTRSAPCANFQTAQDVTSIGGEINCVDAGDFSPNATLTITKSITIDCAGTLGATTLFNLHVAGPGITVRLRNLTFQGDMSGSVAINFINGVALYVEHCAIHGWQNGSGIGILFTPPNGVAASLYVTDSYVTNNGLPTSGGGIIIFPAGSGSARVVIERSHVEGNTYGIFANGSSSTGSVLVQITDSVVANNVFQGISAYTQASAATTSVVVERSSSVLNRGAGIQAQNTGAYVTLTDSSVLWNATGLATVTGGGIFSFGNNRIAGNGDGASLTPGFFGLK